jgi:hypothetical protein
MPTSSSLMVSDALFHLDQLCDLRWQRIWVVGLVVRHGLSGYS